MNMKDPADDGATPADRATWHNWTAFLAQLTARSSSAGSGQTTGGPFEFSVFGLWQMRDALEEATFFADKLTESGQQVQVLIVNRVHPAFGDESPAGLRATAERLRAEGTDDAVRLGALYDNLADFRSVAILERTHLDELRASLGRDTRVAYVPYLAHDVYDFAALRSVGQVLFDGSVPAR